MLPALHFLYSLPAYFFSACHRMPMSLLVAGSVWRDRCLSTQGRQNSHAGPLETHDSSAYFSKASDVKGSKTVDTDSDTRSDSLERDAA